MSVVFAIFHDSDNTHYEILRNNLPVCIEDELPFEIPENWAWARLGQISTYAETKKKVKPQEVLPTTWGLDLEDIEKGGRLIAKRSVSERNSIGEKVTFSRGDILYSRLRPYLLKILVAPDDGICTSEIVPFNVFNDLDPYFIALFLKSPEVDSFVNSSTFGIKMPRVAADTMTALFVPIPPIAEQKRIISKIEELNPYIDEYDQKETELTRLNTEFPEALKKSILQEAVMGKLVPQNPDDEPASVLLERIRAEKEKLIAEGKIKRDKNESRIYRRGNSYYENQGGKERCIDNELPFEIPENWAWSRLGTPLFKLTDGTHTTPKYNLTGVPFISVKDISSGKLDFTNCKRIAVEDHNTLFRRCNPEKGDILLTKVGTTGIPVLVATDEEFSLFVSVALLKFQQQLINGNFLVNLIQSPLVQIQAAENTKGVGNKNWVIRDIANTLIVLPPLEEQIRIVVKIFKLHSKFNCFPSSQT